MKTVTVKSNSILGKKVKHYLEWKYKGNRSAVIISVKDGVLKVRTRCHKKDHYPERVRKIYRQLTHFSEVLNWYDVNDVWNNRKGKLFTN